MNKIETLDEYSKDRLIYKLIVDIINNFGKSEFEKCSLLNILNKLYKKEVINHGELDSLIIFVRSKFTDLLEDETLVLDYKPYIDSFLDKSNIADYICDLHSKSTFFVTKLGILNNLFPNRKPGSLNRIVNDNFVVSVDQEYFLVIELICENSTLIVKSNKHEECILGFDGNYLCIPTSKSRLKFIQNGYYLCDNQNNLDIIDEKGFVYFTFDPSFNFSGTLKDEFGNIFRLIGKKTNDEFYTKELYYNVVHDLGVLSFIGNYECVHGIEYINGNIFLKGIKDGIEGYYDKNGIHLQNT